MRSAKKKRTCSGCCALAVVFSYRALAVGGFTIGSSSTTVGGGAGRPIGFGASSCVDLTRSYSIKQVVSHHHSYSSGVKGPCYRASHSLKGHKNEDISDTRMIFYRGSIMSLGRRTTQLRVRALTDRKSIVGNGSGGGGGLSGQRHAFRSLQLNFSSSSSSAETVQAPPLYKADVVVIGGGHAGCEAAAASARTGANTILLTQNKDTIGELSCNPSVGGIGKGHLVREVDALDGVMGRIIDEAGIHFRMLNRRKGPAVRGPRAQADRDIYRSSMQSLLGSYPHLQIVEGSAEDLLLDGDVVKGVVTGDGREIECNAVVITTGTFLRGKCYIGQKWYWAGRHLRDSAEVEPPSVGLALTLERFKFPLSRLKTGTPPRLNGDTIDWSVLEPQPSEMPPIPFSYMNMKKDVPLIDRLISCAKTYTNEQTHKIVMANAHLLPEPSKDGVGPRYCPSIYKKCERFPDRNSHLSWLEPEGLNTNVVYPNGMSGPFPEEIQLQIVRSMKGLEEVEIIRPGYDVEYDYVDPTSLTHTLETKQIGGLFLAGQICGTTGYEEAAAQGIVAGANAGLKVQGRPRFVVGRDEGYIGVLVDDLVTKGTKEPYRMFTSRAEYRLYMRADNADLRLTEKGATAGIVGEERRKMFKERQTEVDRRLNALTTFALTPHEWDRKGIVMGKKGDGQRKTAAEVVSMPDVNLSDVETVMYDHNCQEKLKAYRLSLSSAKDAAGDIAALKALAEDRKGLFASTTGGGDGEGDDAQAWKTQPWAYDTVEAQCKYSNYMVKQASEMESWRRSLNVRIPSDVEYTREELPPLSGEELEKLRKHRPDTFAAAGSISGITPNSLVYLYNYVKRRNKARSAQRKKEIVSHHFPDSGESSALEELTTDDDDNDDDDDGGDVDDVKSDDEDSNRIVQKVLQPPLLNMEVAGKL